MAQRPGQLFCRRGIRHSADTFAALAAWVVYTAEEGAVAACPFDEPSICAAGAGWNTAAATTHKDVRFCRRAPR